MPQIFSRVLNRAEIGKMIRFLIVGLAATFVDLIVTFVLLTLVGESAYQSFISNAFGDSSMSGIAGIGDLLQKSFEEVVSVVAFCTAFSVSFFGHSSFSFHKKRSLGVLWRLFVVNTGALVLRVLIISTMKSCLNLSGYIPVVTAMVVVTVISYVLSRYWVFKKAQDLPEKLPEKLV